MPRSAGPKNLCLPAFIAALICGAAIIAILYIPQPVGLANNGDFLRVIHTTGIAYADGKPDKDRFAVEYRMKLQGDTAVQKLFSVFELDHELYEYRTSQSVFVILSKALNLAWNKLTGAPAANYSIIWLGMIYISVFLCALYLILSFVYRRFGRGMFVFAALAALLIFCDQGYLLYFNSFYGEALQYASTFLAIGLYMRLCEKPERGFPSYLLYYSAVMVMAASKNAYAPVGVLFGLLPLALWRKLAFQKWLAVSGAVALTVWGIALVLFLTPAWIEKDTNFDAVFAGILPQSDTPERDLAKLGLDADLAVLKGHEAYQSEYPIDVFGEDFNARFYDKISKGKILAFYLRNPGRLWEAVKTAAFWSKAIRPGYLTNYRNPSVPGQQSRRFSLWETARGAIGVNRLWLILAVFGLTLGVIVSAIIARPRKKARADAAKAALTALLAAILASAAFCFVIPYISNGVCDIAKHMFGFVALYDALLVVLAGYAGWSVCNLRDKFNHSAK